MSSTIAFARRAAAVPSILIALAACSSLGGLGSVLGGGQQQTGQVSGVVQNVDTRNQQIVLQATNGQQVALFFNQQTQVTYQNRAYSVMNLERGDRVTARVQQAQNGGYYTDLVQVDQSVQTSNGDVYSSTPSRVQGSGGYGDGTVQTLQGTVRQVDRRNGVFVLDVGNYNTLTVSLPYNPTQNDLNRFQTLRVGDSVRITGVYLNNNRVELRRFY